MSNILIVDPSLTGNPPATARIAAGVGGIPLPDVQSGAPARGGLLVVPHSSDKKTFSINAVNLAPTSVMDIFVVTVQNNGSPAGRIRRLIIWNPGMQTTPGIVALQFGPVAGYSLGSSTVPARYVYSDVLDNNFFVGVGNSSGGGSFAGTQPFTIALFVPGAVAAFTPLILDFPAAHGLSKSFSTGSGAVQVLRHPGAAGAAGFYATLEFVTEPISTVIG